MTSSQLESKPTQLQGDHGDSSVKQPLAARAGDSGANFAPYRLGKPPAGAHVDSDSAAKHHSESPAVAAMLGSFELKNNGAGLRSKVDRPTTRKYEDGSQYTRKDLPGGKVEHTGTGPPADTFRVIDTADGKYKVLDGKGEALERSTNPEVVKERTRLDQAAEKGITNPEDRAKFHADMAKLEQRFPKNPDEVAKTFSDVAAMLENKQNAAIKPENIEKLAKAVMSQAATPKMVDQGNHPTCSISSLESIVYHDTPSVASGAMKDIALKGEHEMSDGKVVKFDNESLEANGDAANSRRLDGDRSLATQYMNVLMTNSVLSERGNGLSLRSTSRGDERIQTKPGEEPQVVGKTPDLSNKDMVHAYRQLTGEKGKKVLMVIHESKAEKDAQGRVIDTDGIAVYRDQKEYEQILEDLKRKQALPVVSEIDVRNDFRPNKGGAAAACRAEGADDTPDHALVIDDISKKGVSINNQWGDKCDYTLPADKAYAATKDKTQEIMDRIAKGYQTGNRDFAAEIMHTEDLYREMRKIHGADTSSESFRSNLEFEMREAEKIYKEKGENRFTPEAVSLFGDAATRMLNQDDRLKLAESMKESPLFKNQQGAIDLVGDIY